MSNTAPELYGPDAVTAEQVENARTAFVSAEGQFVNRASAFCRRHNAAHTTGGALQEMLFAEAARLSAWNRYSELMEARQEQQRTAAKRAAELRAQRWAQK
ncbi:hypothetical protein KXR83_04890 [Williamsia muralis]|uniref:hypothetical protein n=1 Tax=Williamsia marianensis TaxID=85044 RepID=UPI003F181F96